MDAATITAVITASLAGGGAIVLGIIKAMKAKDEKQIACLFVPNAMAEQTGLLREIRDGVTALKYEFVSQRDKQVMVGSSLERIHNRLDSVLGSRKP